MFSIAKGGDYIDHAVGSVVGESATRVKVIKEEGVDLGRAPKDKVEKALHIYYEDLVDSLVEALRRAMSRAEKMPRADRPLPIVIAGGTAKPRGFKELFERALKSRSLPVEISGVRLAGDPLTATARGALIAAMYEK
jgi:tRNA A37 threonylcarbamoyltransferase TsaD